MFSKLSQEIKKTLTLSAPLVIAQMVYATSGFISTAMIAHLGVAAMSANVLVWSLWFALIVFFFGVLNAVGILVSHQHGARSPETIRHILRQSYWLGFFICIAMTLILQCMPFFLALSHPSPDVARLAKQSMHALLWTTPGLMALVVTEQFLGGIGQTKLLMKMSMIVVPFEIVMMYVLIFGKFGFHAFGIAGVGYGFTVSYTLSAIGLMTYLGCSKKFAEYGLFQKITHKQVGHLKELLRVGLPMGLMAAIETIAFAVATFAIAFFGVTTLAAHQMVLQYLGMAVTLIFAMSQAVSIRVGHAVGENNLLGVRQAVDVGLFLNLCVTVIVALALYFFPTFFLRLDINIHLAANQPLIHQASTFLTICAVLLIFDNFRIISFGSLRGLKDAHFPMYTSLISFWGVGLGLAFLFGFYFHLEGVGIWLGLVSGIFTGAVILYCRLRYLLKRIDLKKILTIKK